MGGRGSTSKILSNIDAKRYEGKRAERAKEIAAQAKKPDPYANSTPEHRAKMKALNADPNYRRAKAFFKGNENFGEHRVPIVEKTGHFQAYTKTNSFNGESGFRKTDHKSIAHSQDGRIHLFPGGKSGQHVMDGQTGTRIAKFKTKKDAIGFMNAVTRADGKTSKTIGRFGGDSAKAPRRTNRALNKVITKYHGVPE
jgi:hypothetical protein